MKETYPFLDLDHILRSAHGYRTTDALRKWCLIEDADLLAKEVVRFETAILEAAKARSIAGGDGIVCLPGVKKLIAQLGAGAEERGGAEGWAICTSCASSSFPRLSFSSAERATTTDDVSACAPAPATHFYASQAIPTAGLPTPKLFVTAESVTKGKPHPDPYLLGAKLSECDAADCPSSRLLACVGAPADDLLSAQASCLRTRRRASGRARRRAPSSSRPAPRTRALRSRSKSPTSSSRTSPSAFPTPPLPLSLLPDDN